MFWTLASLVLLWPLLVATEFKPWVLVDARNRDPTPDAVSYAARRRLMR